MHIFPLKLYRLWTASRCEPIVSGIYLSADNVAGDGAVPNGQRRKGNGQSSRAPQHDVNGGIWLALGG